MSRTSWLNIASIAIPLICLLLAGGVTFYEVQRIRRLDAELKQTERNIAFVQKIREEIDRMPSVRRFPAAEMSPREQTDFLNTLRAYALANRVTLVRWTNAPIAPNRPSAETPRGHLPPDITPISGSVQVGGLYSNVRGFLYDLLQGARLFTINDIRWRRGQKWPATNISFTLTRYVTTTPLSMLGHAAPSIGLQPSNTGSPRDVSETILQMTKPKGAEVLLSERKTLPR